jgi:hypothetical protein
MEGLQDGCWRLAKKGCWFQDRLCPPQEPEGSQRACPGKTQKAPNHHQKTGHSRIRQESFLPLCYIHLDRYAKLQSDGAYSIVSLYLDSHNFKLCRESMIGKKNRFKLRIRSYDDDTSTPYFFEIKRRLNNIIIKSRARVTHDNMVDLLAGRSVSPAKYKADEQTLRQFQLYMRCINAKPAIRIRYMRKAYEDDSDNRVRVTFDRLLCHNASSEPIVMFNGTGWQRHKFDNVILELKFTARYPAWLSRMVKYFDLRRESISKYVTSVKHACSMGFCAPNLSV